jgi:septum formation protein
MPNDNTRLRWPLVLASASTARSQLLATAGIEHWVEVSHVDESQLNHLPARERVLALATAKAEAVAARISDALVLGCDSLLDVAGRALGKPRSAQEAAEYWELFAGRSALLHTGHALLAVRDHRILQRASAVAEAELSFARPNPAQLEAYIASGEPLQVAGAFTIEGRSAPFIERISGSPSTVLGLSLPVLRRLLEEVGSSIEQHWASAR